MTGAEGGRDRDKDRLVNRSQSRQGLEDWLKQSSSDVTSFPLLTGKRPDGVKPTSESSPGPLSGPQFLLPLLERVSQKASQVMDSLLGYKCIDCPAAGWAPQRLAGSILMP